MESTVAPVELVEIELEGFKSFKCRTTIGPFDQFTCVIGPNGCGKSVVGEAIAFALGGNKSMLRAKTLAALINEETRREGNGCAIVTIRLRIGSPDHERTMSLRRILQGRASEAQILRPGASCWQKITQDQMKGEVKGLGIQTDVVDRFIVTQNRQAVNVQCPAALLKYIEMLIGTDGCEEQIAQIQKNIAAGRGVASKMNEDILRLQDKREVLSPHVKKWVKLMADVAVFETKKRALLSKQAAYLNKMYSEKEKEVASLHETLEEVRANFDSVTDKIKSLHRDRNEKQTALDRAIGRLDEMEELIEHLEIEQTKREAQIAALKSDAGSRQTGLAKAEKSMKTNEGKLKGIERQLKNVESEMGDMGKAERGCEIEVQRLMGLKRNPTRKQAAELARAEAELQGIRSQISELETKAALREAKLLKCKKRIEVLKIAVEKQEAENQSHNKRIADAQDSLVSTRQDIRRSEAAVRGAEEQKERLRVCLVGAQAQLEIARQAQHAAREETDACGKSASKVDAAIFELSQTLAAPNRKFYGRLNNIARVACPSAAVAVNAVLREATNLSSCLVVGDRPTALEVLKYFEKNKVGVVTCKILAEISGVSAHTRGRGIASTGCSLLVDLVHVDEAFEETRPVFEALLGSWFFVDTKEKALRLIDSAEPKRKMNIVSRAGELFKADGEVVGNSSQANVGYLLTTQVQRITKSLAAQRRKDKKKDAKEANDLERKAIECKVFMQDMLKQVEEAEGLWEKRRRQLEALIDKEKKLLLAVERAGIPAPSVELHTSEQKLKEAQLELGSLLKSDSQKDALHQLVTVAANAQSAYDALRCKAEGGRHLVEAESKLGEVRDTIKQLGKEKGRLESEMQNVVRQLKNAEIEIERQKESDDELKALVRECECAAVERERWEKEAAEKRLWQEDATEQLRVLKKTIMKKSKARDALNDELHDNQATIEHLRSEMTDIRHQVERITECLNELPQAPESTVPGNEEENGDGSARLRRRCRRDFSQSASIDGLRLSGGSDFELRCEEEACALAREETRLELDRKAIDPEALDEDLAALEALQEIEEKLQQQNELLTQMSCAKANLEEERYQKFLSAMEFVNVKLSDVYRCLTGNHGDALCTFPEDKCMLFSEGVTFNIRPDRHRWRPFSTLSGGQQSLATLSLSFALQAAFPSPFYFFDEIDCALDAANAVRVADFIQNQSSAQYIVVSHKPQVFERAGCLVGVYSVCGSAAAVTLPIGGKEQ